MSTQSVQTSRSACAEQHGDHANARARTFTHGDLRALSSPHSAHARNSPPTDCEPEATTQAHKAHRSSRQPPRESPACACGLAWPLAGRRGSPLPPLHTLAAAQRPTKKVPSTFSSATPRGQYSCFLRKNCRRDERTSPSKSRTARSASGSKK